VTEHIEKIELFYLPSYSTERNPDEYQNCDLKYGLSAKPAPKTQDEMKENLENHMNMLRNDSARLAKYFKPESIKYAA
jgi:hypothetical protein